MTIYKFTSYSDASFDVRPIEVEEKSKSYVTSDRFHINKSSINCLNKSTAFDEMYSTDSAPCGVFNGCYRKKQKAYRTAGKRTQQNKSHSGKMAEYAGK